MTPTFYINNFNTNQPAQLIAEIDAKHLYVCTFQNNSITTLAAYVFDDENAQTQLNTVLNEENILQQAFSKVNIICAGKQSMLIPPAFFTTDAAKQSLELIYGNINADELKTDFLYRHNIHNAYKVTETIQKAISQKFPFANYTHQYSLLPDVIELKGTKLFIVFYAKHFTVLLCKENNLQLIQQFDFSNGEDVAYYLLAMLQQANIDLANIELIVCGMIEKWSNLHNELYKYFDNINFASLPGNFEYADEIKALPEHYFSHLFAYISCV
ncbi:MAG: DUF3822 family protein [Chitinophagaceae bacterium]|nr:DUF3822 family protein [Chitinophagaceae bacterium]